MQIKKNVYKIIQVAAMVFLTLFMVSDGSAELKLDSVYPAESVAGQEVKMTLTGSGFDENTRVSIYPDTGNYKKKIIGSVDTRSNALGVTISGNTAFVACGGYEKWCGLQIIDVSDLKNPAIIGSVDTPDYAKEVAVSGNTAFVAAWSNGLQIIDVSKPESPVIIGSADVPYANGIAVSGNTVFVVCGGYRQWNGLQIIDVSNPKNPVIIGNVGEREEPTIIITRGTPSGPREVAVSGDTAFVADDTGLQIIDVSDLKNPVVTGKVYINAAKGISVSESTVFVAGDNLRITDMSDPKNPSTIGAADTPGTARARDVMVSGDTAFVADDSGLQIIDVSDLSEPVTIRVEPMSYATDVTVSGTTAFVNCNPLWVGGWGGVQIMDVSDPENPSLIGAESALHAFDATVSGTAAFMAGYGLKIIDMSSLENPVIIGAVDTPPSYYAPGIAISGTTAFMTQTQPGLEIIDVSDLENPVIIGAVDTPGYSGEVKVSGNMAFVADGSAGLQIIDISDLKNPVIIGTAETPKDARGVTVSGNTAFVTYDYDYFGGFEIIDVSDPENPVIIGDSDARGFSAHDVIVSGNTAFVSGEYLQAIDISDLENLIIIGTVDTPGIGWGLAVSGNTAYVADGMAGLVTVPLPVEIRPVDVSSETSISFTLPTPQVPGYYILRVFNETESYELPRAVYCSEPDNNLENGYSVIPELKIKAVINTVEKGRIEAIWQKGGEDETARGDKVLWGHFYASPDDVEWGSPDNPDLFVKIWLDANGRTDVNFFHVSVPNIEVYSEYDSRLVEHNTATMNRRYVRHYYENGRSASEEN